LAGLSSFNQELDIVKTTTANDFPKLDIILNSEEIVFFQNLIRRIPVPDNVFQYAVNIAAKTRPNTSTAHDWANKYITWGAGPRASQFMIIGAKCHAAINGKYSPDIEDVQAVTNSVLRHRIVRNYKAEADGVGIDNIVKELIK